MHKPPRSAYIHIPFCHRRCFYCDFTVVPLGDKVESQNGTGSGMIKDYLYFLFREILSIRHKAPLSTIYIGGGTPSILHPSQIKNLINLFKENYGINFGAEVTMEIDPASFNENDLYGFIDAGINRFSLGAQSFNDQILQKAGRRHLGKDAEKACQLLKKAKDFGLIKSWSLDLIQNLPKSNLQEWKNDLEKALNFCPPHISIYDLNIEEGTVFKKLLERGTLPLPNDDQSYENSSLKDVLLKNSGYSRYEISNYSLPGHHSRHNRVYWKGSGWWGFGQGSTSSPWGEKFTRPKISKDYKNWVTNQSESELEPSLINEKNQYKELDEKIMLGLRLKEGIDIKELFNEQKWNKKKVEINYKKLLIEWDKYLDNGLLINIGNRFFLSNPKGMELSNQVMISMFKWWDKIC